MIDITKIDTGLSDLRKNIEQLEQSLVYNKEQLNNLKPYMKQADDRKDKIRQLKKELRLKRNTLNTICGFIDEPLPEKQQDLFEQDNKAA